MFDSSETTHQPSQSDFGQQNSHKSTLNIQVSHVYTVSTSLGNPGSCIVGYFI